MRNNISSYEANIFDIHNVWIDFHQVKTDPINSYFPSSFLYAFNNRKNTRKTYTNCNKMLQASLNHSALFGRIRQFNHMSVVFELFELHLYLTQRLLHFKNAVMENASKLLLCNILHWRWINRKYYISSFTSSKQIKKRKRKVLEFYIRVIIYPIFYCTVS